MIITLISLGLLIVGIALFIVSDNVIIRNSIMESVVCIGGFISTVLGALGSFFAIIFICMNVINYDVDYQNMFHKKEMLEYRIEHIEENITGNEMLYNDIVEFNNDLRNTKKWANNPWTSWFNNKNIASIDYIELDSN